MKTPAATIRDWDESPSATGVVAGQTGRVFENFFERSLDALWLFDTEAGVFVDCNQAAVELIGAESKAQLLQLRPEDHSPAFQPDGTPSDVRTVEILSLVEKHNGYRFEWTMRHKGGRDVPVEVAVTPVVLNGRRMNVAVVRDISERKQAERELRELNQSLERRVEERTAALRESEEKFRALFEDSSEGIVLHDEQQILEANPAAVRILELQSPQELIGRHPSDTSPPFQPNGESSAELAGKYIQQCMMKGSARFEWTSRTAQGRAIPLEVSLTRIHWGGRQVIQALIHDISERKKAEAELRASEARLRESEARFSVAFQASPVIIGILRGSDGKFVLMNDALVNWLGCSREVALGQSCAALGMWQNLADRASIWEEVGRVGSIRQRECRWRNRHGEQFTVLLSAETITMDNAPHVLLLALDITQRKLAEVELRASETRLRESEARFSAAFHSSPVITAISRSTDAKFVLANDAFLSWAGYTREEVLGRTANELGIWVTAGERSRFWDDVRAAGPNKARECRLRNRSGKICNMLASGTVIAFDGVDHFLGMMVDITQRKLAEAELHKTLAREMELSQLKSNFVSMVSHEFRTPLGIIQSSAELLRDYYERMQVEERREQFDSIARNTNRMAGMMEEILILSRLDAGKVEFRPVALNLDSYCRRLVDEVLSATNRRCVIKFSLMADMPEANADERLLGHIFTNLLSNAAKYSEPGASVQFEIQREGADAVCVVRDAGIGISDEDQQHLFKAFHRGGNVGTRPGTGLGLLVVKRCIELHCGRVRLASKLGEGTTVTVRLPIFGKDT